MLGGQRPEGHGVHTTGQDLLGGVLDQGSAGGLIEFAGARHARNATGQAGLGRSMTEREHRLRTTTPHGGLPCGPHRAAQVPERACRLRRMRLSTHQTTSTRTTITTMRENTLAYCSAMCQFSPR